MTARLIIGYGNSLLGDDAAGSAVASRFTGRTGFTTIIVPELLPELAEVIAAAAVVIFVDASQTAERVECTRLNQCGTRSLGHSSDPGYLLGLAEALYNARPPAWLIAVPASDFRAGAGLSQRTAALIPEAARMTEALCTNFPS